MLKLAVKTTVLTIKLMVLLTVLTWKITAALVMLVVRPFLKAAAK